MIPLAVALVTVTSSVVILYVIGVPLVIAVVIGWVGFLVTAAVMASDTDDGP